MPKGKESKEGKGRPGGNPEISKYAFQQKHNWDEPCNERMQLRMTASMKKAIKDGLIDDWQEVCRQAIAKAIEEARSKNPQQNP